jgi:hypothetical protein
LKFADVIRNLRQGSAEREIEDALQEASNAVLDTGKAASLTFTITLTPMGSGKVRISDKIVTKKPEISHEDTLFFITESGLLSRKDPRQMTLEELNTR